MRGGRGQKVGDFGESEKYSMRILEWNDNLIN